MLIIYFYIYIYIYKYKLSLSPFFPQRGVAEFWTVSVSVSGFAPRPEKKPPKKVVSQILFVTLPCLSLNFLFLFATRRYVEFFDMARPWAAFVAQDIKSIINYSAAE